jgi:hypothetical protein
MGEERGLAVDCRLPTPDCRLLDCRLTIEICGLWIVIADCRSGLPLVRTAWPIAQSSVSIDNRQSQSVILNLNRQATIERSEIIKRQSAMRAAPC